MSSLNSRSAIFCLLFFLSTVPGYAQVSIIDSTSFNAEFAGGGARALSMGGAFIGLGDDATATEFNPAGLWQLRRPEIAAQIIHTWDERRTGLPFSSIFGGDEIEMIKKDVRDTYWIPSFASVVIPTQHVAIGLSEFTNIYSRRSYEDPVEEGGRISSNMTNNGYGLTLARRIVDHFNIGTTVRYNIFYYRDELGRRFGEDGFSSKSWSANFGLLWRPHRLFQIGAVYKMPQGIEGEYRGRNIDTELPDTIGLGVALLPDDRWRILFDVDRVQWSRFETSSNSDFYRDDVWRYHAGAEWHAATWGSTAFFLRGGYMFEESNALKYKGDDPFFREYMSGAESTQHYTFGFGIARPRYQFDVGVDLTEEKGQDFIASMVYYF